MLFLEVHVFFINDWKENALLRLPVLVAVHCVRLARARLPIAKDGRVEAINNVLDHGVNISSSVDVLLRTRLVEHFIKN